MFIETKDMLRPKIYVINKRKVYDVDYVSFDDKYYGVTEKNGLCDEYNFDDVALMENTGYKDKNGKYIYVGDIVSFRDSFEEWQYDGELSVSDGSNIAAVEKDKTNVTLTKFQSPGGMLEKMLLEREVLFDNQPFEEFEVIGNIYENEELLKNE